MPQHSPLRTWEDVAAAPAARRSNRWSAVGYGWLWVSAAAIAVLAVTPYLTASLNDLGRADNQFAVNYAGRATWVQVAFYLHIVRRRGG